MEYTKLLPLLSDSLKEIFESVYQKHPECKIASEILTANTCINTYNSCVIDLTYNPISDKKYLVQPLLDIINSLITDEARMLTYRINSLTISFLPKGKEAKYSDCGIWSREGRQESKPSKLIQRVLKHEYKCKEFEDFANWIKNEFFQSGEFKLVSGSDITKYYNVDNYYKDSGTLGNSCMRHEECESYFKIYEDHAKMLGCFKDGLLMGRAIVWEPPEGTFMDRFYTCEDFLDSQFIEYAKDHKWYYRVNNSLLETNDRQYWFCPNDNYTTANYINLTIRLDKDYDYFPYLDSFRYVSKNRDYISTNPDDGFYTADSTEGYLNGIDRELYTCYCCGETAWGYEGDGPENWCYSQYYEDWLCPDCAIYCNWLDDWFSKDEEFVSVNINPTRTEEIPLSYIKNDNDYTFIEGKWYYIWNPNVLTDKDGKYYIAE